MNRPITLPSHAHLDQLGIPYQRRSFPTTIEKGAASVTRALGFAERQMVKTLIFETDRSERTLIMLGGDQSAVSDHLKKLLGLRNIRLASTESVLAATGYSIGSIPPFHWQPAGFRSFFGGVAVTGATPSKFPSRGGSDLRSLVVQKYSGISPLSSLTLTSSSDEAESAISRAVPRPVSRRRILMWDRLRLVAFFDIVSIHVTADYAVFGAGLPLFLILRFALGARHATPQPFGEFCRLQVRRLLLPWAAWSVLLGGIRWASSLRHGVPMSEAFSPDMLLYGTERYLWFLPFAVIAGVVTYLLDRATQKVQTTWLVTECVLVAACLSSLPNVPQLAYPFGKWMFGAPAIPLGLAAGRILARPEENARRTWTCLLAVSLVATLFLCRGWFSGETISLVTPLRYAIAVTLLGIGVLLPKREDRWTLQLTPLLLGGYLLHDVAYYQVIYRLANVAHVTLAPMLRTLITVCLTLVVVSIMRRTRLRTIL